MNQEQQRLFDFSNHRQRVRQKAIVSNAVREALEIEQGRREKANRELIQDKDRIAYS